MSLPPLPDSKDERLDKLYELLPVSVIAALPPLPEPVMGFDGDEIREYGRACWNAAIEAAIEAASTWGDPVMAIEALKL